MHTYPEEEETRRVEADVNSWLDSVAADCMERERRSGPVGGLEVIFHKGKVVQFSP